MKFPMMSYLASLKLRRLRESAVGVSEERLIFAMNLPEFLRTEMGLAV
jgi:hypothetical protein